MSDFNSLHNRAVWFDIPVADLDRSAAFYAAILGIKVHKEQFEGYTFCILDHQDGNGGCLVKNESEINSNSGILVYMNVNTRIRDAVTQVEKCGGRVVQPIHAIGPHGFRAIVLDSEGNRIVLHSTVDG
ncbi:MAG: VOC family protein [Casimicrobiaceae bacterium]